LIEVSKGLAWIRAQVLGFSVSGLRCGDCFSKQKVQDAGSRVQERHPPRDPGRDSSAITSSLFFIVIFRVQDSGFTVCDLRFENDFGDDFRICSLRFGNDFGDDFRIYSSRFGNDSFHG